METVDYTALPADMVRAIEAGDGYRVPCHVSQSFDHYLYVVCDRCDQPITGHVWFAADRLPQSNRVLRCSNSETS